MLKNSFNIKHITSPVNNWKGCTSWRQRNKSWRHIILWLSTHCHEINREAFTYPQNRIVPSYPMTERIYSIYRYMPIFLNNCSRRMPFILQKYASVADCVQSTKFADLIFKTVDASKFFDKWLKTNGTTFSWMAIWWHPCGINLLHCSIRFAFCNLSMAQRVLLYTKARL